MWFIQVGMESPAGATLKFTSSSKMVNNSLFVIDNYSFFLESQCVFIGKILFAFSKEVN